MICYWTFKKKDEKCLILDWTDKLEEALSKIRSEIKTINGRKELFYKKYYAKNGTSADDNLPLNKTLNLPTSTIIIRYVLQENEKLYPQICLGQCLYELKNCCNMIKLMFQKN